MLTRWDEVRPGPTPQGGGPGRIHSRRLIGKARRGFHPRRAFSLPFSFSFSSLGGAILVAAPFYILAQPAFAETSDCAAVPEGERMLCLVTAQCNALADPAKKEDCLRAAADLGASLATKPTDPIEPAEPVEQAAAPTTEAQPVAEVQPPPQEPVAPQSVTRQSVTPQPVTPQPPQLETTIVAPAVPPPPPVQPSATPSQAPETAEASVRRDSPVSQSTVERAVLDIPKSFVGDVTAFRALVRDRQLIAVNDQLLFEGDVATSSDIELGDMVTVQRLSSRFRSDRFRIIPPSKRAIMARRIQCERVELPQETRRKCALIENANAAR